MDPQLYQGRRRLANPDRSGHIRLVLLSRRHDLHSLYDCAPSKRILPVPEHAQDSPVAYREYLGRRGRVDRSYKLALLAKDLDVLRADSTSHEVAKPAGTRSTIGRPGDESHVVMVDAPFLDYAVNDVGRPVRSCRRLEDRCLIRRSAA